MADRQIGQDEGGGQKNERQTYTLYPPPTRYTSPDFFLPPILKRSQVAAAYERYAARISDFGYRHAWAYIATKAPSDWALLAGLTLKGKRVLNVGCSEPIDELFLVPQGVRSWIALDQSWKMLATAREILHRELSSSLVNCIGLCTGDATHLPFLDRTFDLVLSFSTLEHIDDPDRRQQAFRELARVTKDGGHVAVTVPNKYSLFFFCHRRNMLRKTAEYGYAHLYTPRKLRMAMRQAGLRLLSFQSEVKGMADLPSYVPIWRLRSLLRLCGYFGERIGYLAEPETV